MCYTWGGGGDLNNVYKVTVEIIVILLEIFFVANRKSPEEVRHACTNHYKFNALMSLRSCDNVQAKCTELVVIRARMSDSSGKSPKM